MNPTKFSKKPDRVFNSRRAFLRGVGTTGLALPFLESLPERSAFAQDGSNAVFGLFIMTSCGVVRPRFWPSSMGALTTQGMAGDTGRAASVLADHADRLLFVEGLGYPNGSVGCGHASGLAQSLTGARISGSGPDVLPDGVSCDHVIAEGLGVNPLTLYAGLKGGYIDEKVSFTAPRTVRAAEDNPYNVYLDLAGLLDSGTGGPTPVAGDLAAKSKSINDLVREDLSRMMNSTRISYADKQRLQLHLDSIRDIENNMNNMGMGSGSGSGAVCSGANLDLAALEEINGNSLDNGRQEDVVKLHLELVALAFSCNVTRVATLQAGDGTDGTQYTINGQRYERFHHISHRINGDGTTGSPIAGAEDKHHDIDRLRLETFAYGIEKWKQYDTPNGPLLDNGFMYWSSHVGDGPAHDMRNLPVIVAGSAGGKLKQGQYIRANGHNSQLLNSLINACGVQSENFGSGNGGQLDAAHA